MHQLLRMPVRIVTSVMSWHVSSQQRARRNALVACTALLQRRREREDVEAFLVARARAAPVALITSTVRVPRPGAVNH